MFPFTEKTNKGLLGLAKPSRSHKSRTKTLSSLHCPPLAKPTPSLSPRKDHILASLQCTKTLDLSKGHRLFDSLFGLAEDSRRAKRRAPRLPLGLWKSQDLGKAWKEPEIVRGEKPRGGFSGAAELLKRSKSLVFA